MNVPTFVRAPRVTRSTSYAPRQVIPAGEPLCPGCRDRGLIEIKPVLASEYCIPDVRRGLDDGALKLCPCVAGRPWVELLKPIF